METTTPINGHNDLSAISTWLREIKTDRYDKAESDTARYLREMDEQWDEHCEWMAEHRGAVTDRHGNTN